MKKVVHHLTEHKDLIIFQLTAEKYLQVQEPLGSGIEEISFQLYLLLG